MCVLKHFFCIISKFHEIYCIITKIRESNNIKEILRITIIRHWSISKNVNRINHRNEFYSRILKE